MNASYPDLKNKTVVVTGVAQGIGRGLSEAFLGIGARVVGIARGDVDWSVDSNDFTLVQQDVRDQAGIGHWLKNFEDRGGRINVWINNAGVLISENLLDATPKAFDVVFGTNVQAPFFLSQAVARHMKVRGGGVILQLSSFAATLPSVGSGLYAASKAALRSLTRSMAAEWAPYDIRVNAISPGVVPTRMTESVIQARLQDITHDLALRRLGTVGEVADVALFLASDASRYITGEDVAVTGGKFAVQNPGTAWEVNE